MDHHSAHHTGAPHHHAAHGGHTAPGEHAARAEHAPGASWGTAVKATLHCLTGCAIGEILGMVIGTALLWGNVPTMVLAIALAFLFGYSFTLFAVVRAGLDLKSAIKVALAADTVSIAVMEFVDNLSGPAERTGPRGRAPLTDQECPTAADPHPTAPEARAPRMGAA